MMRVLGTLILIIVAGPPLAAASRTVEAVYTATLTDLPHEARELKVWIPLPRAAAKQSIANLQIDSPWPWTRRVDPEYGNDYIFLTIPEPGRDSLSVKVRFRVTRSVHLLASEPVTEPSARELERNLKADRLVTISPRIRSIAEELTAGRTTPLTQARAIYEYVLSTMTYDKVKPGWGEGDSERACDIRAGNCTDFHSLFISLARAKGIPARFIIGFSMGDESSGRATGYHCWAEFYVEGLGWVAVDPSEASKSSDPIRRNFLFGNLDHNRVEVTTGRDIRVEPPVKEPLNYFIYPYAEADGEPAGIGAISLDYRDVVEAGVPAVAGPAGHD